jgi:transcriptional antiterminator RfaH
MMQWYVVHTLVHGEQRALEHLERQGFAAWLPLYRKARRHARRRETVLRPLFPRYLFVSLDLDADQWRKVLSTRGVKTLISNDSVPTPVPDEIIESLRTYAEDDGLFTVRPVGLKRGDKVRIADGPFAELDAIFEADSDSDRVLVLLNLLGRQTVVRLSSSEIERA